MSLDNPIVLRSLNDYLTIKSAIRLLTVCRIAKVYITVKDYSYKKRIKGVDITTILLMSDLGWYNMNTFFSKLNIRTHKNYSLMKKYVTNRYPDCIDNFKRDILELEFEYEVDLLYYIRVYCKKYKDNILIETLLYNLYNDIY